MKRMDKRTQLLVIAGLLALCAIALVAAFARCTGQPAPATETPVPMEPPGTESTTTAPMTEPAATGGTVDDEQTSQEDQTIVVVSLSREAYERVAHIETVYTVDYGLLICLELTPPNFEALRTAGVEFELLQSVAVRVSKKAYARVAHIEAVHTTEYDTFVWLELTPSNLEKLRATGVAFEPRYRDTLLLFRHGEYIFDPLVEEPSLPAELTANYAAGTPNLYTIQFFGSAKDEWRADLQAIGVEFVGHTGGSSIQARMTPSQAKKVEKLEFVRWVGPYHPVYRISPYLLEFTGTIEHVSVIIYDDGQAGGTVDRTIGAIKGLGGILVHQYKSSISPPKVTAVFALPASALASTAQLNDILWLGYRAEETLEDEMSDQIIAGNGVAVGYEAWLQGVGWRADHRLVAVGSGDRRNGGRG